MDDVRLKKITFRAWHRGFREADLILGGFAEARLSTLSPAELDGFEQLLELPDHDLYNWISEREPTPPEYDTEIMRKIKAFRFELSRVNGPRGA